MQQLLSPSSSIIIVIVIIIGLKNGKETNVIQNDEIKTRITENLRKDEKYFKTKQ